MKKMIAFLTAALLLIGCMGGWAETAEPSLTEAAEAGDEWAMGELAAHYEAEQDLIHALYWYHMVGSDAEKIDALQKALFAEHSLGLEGAANARTLGGYTMADGRHIRPNVLIRSNALNALTEADVAVLENLPLNAIVDFRSASEHDSEPDAAISGAENHWTELPSHVPGLHFEAEGADRVGLMVQLAQQSGMHELYPYLLTDDDTKAVYRAFFDVLLNNADGAVLWHCSQGKDRAGMASLLVLGALGADRATILEDYALTAQVYDRAFEAMMPALADYDPDTETLMHLYGILSADMNNAAIALDRIDEEFGGMEAYLIDGLGLTREEIMQLREMYLED